MKTTKNKDYSSLPNPWNPWKRRGKHSKQRGISLKSKKARKPNKQRKEDQPRVTAPPPPSRPTPPVPTPESLKNVQFDPFMSNSVRFRFWRVLGWWVGSGWGRGDGVLQGKRRSLEKTQRSRNRWKVGKIRKRLSFGYHSLPIVLQILLGILLFFDLICKKGGIIGI